MIGIISDTHDNLPAIERAVEIFNEKDVDLVLHAGDYISPFAVEKFRDLDSKLHGVLGNNDGEVQGIKRKIEGVGKIHEIPATLNIADRKVIVTHKPLEEDFTETFDLIVNGHTHKPKIEKRNGSLIINPGEASGWLFDEKTIAVANLKKMEGKIVKLN